MSCGRRSRGNITSVFLGEGGFAVRTGTGGPAAAPSTGRVGLKPWQLSVNAWVGGLFSFCWSLEGRLRLGLRDGASQSSPKRPRPSVSGRNSDSRLGQRPALDRIPTKPPQLARALGTVPAAHLRRRLPSSGRDQRCQTGRAACARVESCTRGAETGQRRSEEPASVAAAVVFARRWSPVRASRTSGRVDWAPAILFHRRQFLSFPAGSYGLLSGSPARRGSQETLAAPPHSGHGACELPQEAAGLFSCQRPRPGPPSLLFRSPQAQTTSAAGALRLSCR